MITRKERQKLLIPRDEWFGATFEEARIRNLRDAQSIPLENKLAWLDEARIFAMKTRRENTQGNSSVNAG